MKTAFPHYFIWFVYSCLQLTRGMSLLSSNRTNALSVASIVSASIAIILIIILYPFMVPKIITSQSASYIHQTSYFFYLVLTASIVLMLVCIWNISRRQKNLRSDSDGNRQLSSSSLSSSFDSKKFENKINPDNRITKNNPDAMSLTGGSDDGYAFSFISQQSILSIINNILNDRKYLAIFLISGMTYGFFFSMISGTIVYRPQGFSYLYDVTTTPSATTMAYGPIGYIPSISIYLTNNVGIMLIPINIIILIIVSGLVGFNVMLSSFSLIHGLRNRQLQRNRSASILLGSFASITGLFTACPSCASLFIFGTMFGSLSSSVAVITSTLYGLLLMISIPLLIVTPFITTYSIRKAKLSQCRI